MIEPRTVIPWDEYFLDLAATLAARSKHPRVHVGAVLVRSKRIVATGYNGAPCNFPDEAVDWSPGMTWTNRDWTIHAEENALLFAGVQQCEGCTMYVTSVPCPRCFLRMIHCGLVRVLYGPVVYSAASTDAETLQRIADAAGWHHDKSSRYLRKST